MALYHRTSLEQSQNERLCSCVGCNAACPNFAISLIQADGVRAPSTIPDLATDESRYTPGKELAPPPKYTANAGSMEDRPLTHPAEIERVRRFLEFCLKVDYGITTKNELEKEDWLHFMHLRSVTEKLLRRWGPITAKEAYRVEYQSYYFAEPVKALGLPLVTAARMLRYFPLSLRMDGRHVSLFSTLLLRGWNVVANKLLQDRGIFFDAVITDPELRDKCLAKNRKIQGWYFTSLDSPTSYELSISAKYSDKKYGSVTRRMRRIEPPFLQRKTSLLVVLIKKIAYEVELSCCKARADFDQAREEELSMNGIA